MLRFKLSKLKQICASVILPKLLLKSIKYPHELNYNRTLVQLGKASKSTNSGSNNEANEKKMHIIEKCFSNNVPEKEAKSNKANEIQNDDIISPEFYKVTKCDKCKLIISKIFNDKTDVAKKEGVIDAKTLASTSRIEEEKLAQKIEIIDETPHVEAHAPKVEGFNAMPKVLGHESSSTLEMSKNTHQNTHDSGQQMNLDELAKRCMGAPVGEVDKIITRELNNISENYSHPKIDMDLVRNECVKNCCNDTNATLGSFNDINITRFEKIQPLHLDSVPLLALDSSSIITNDYKNFSLIRDYPTIYLTADIDESQLDTPATLSPYEKPAIPFYEYINKENIPRDDDSKMETAAVTETADETEIIINEDALQKDAIPSHPSLDEETLHPKPNINQFTESDIPHLTKPKEIEHISRTLIQNDTFNVFNSQRVFTSNPDQPPDWHMPGQPYQNPQQSAEQPNSSISSAYLPGGNRRTLDLPVNTAISANQNPEEYYMFFPEEFVPQRQSAPVQPIFAEHQVTQNIIFSVLPQIELEEVPRTCERISDNVLNQKDPISRIIVEQEVKQEDSITNKVKTESNLEESVEKKDIISLSEPIPLSLLLKKIREQNRLEYCRNIIAKAQIELEGTKKFSCPPPLDKSKPKNSVKPCQPEPKPKCKPCPEPCPSACPAKKDPCAKLLPIFLSTMIRYDKNYNVIQTPNELFNFNKETIKLSSVDFITYVIKRFERLGKKLKLTKYSNLKNSEDVTVYVRDFEPWIPIPSWPIPKQEKPKPFVCPKEGCKLPAARTNKPRKEKQCEGVSKKSFALSQVFLSPLINIFYNK